MFAKIDLCQTYHHIPVTSTGRDKTTITTLFGIYCVNMTYLSLCGEPSTFMRLISEIKNTLTNVFACLDDAIIYSESEEDH